MCITEVKVCPFTSSGTSKTAFYIHLETLSGLTVIGIAVLMLHEIKTFSICTGYMPQSVTLTEVLNPDNTWGIVNLNI